MTAADLRSLADLAGDLSDPHVMGAAWALTGWLVDKSALVRLGDSQMQRHGHNRSNMGWCGSQPSPGLRRAMTSTGRRQSPNVIIAATAELAGLTVPHWTKTSTSSLRYRTGHRAPSGVMPVSAVVRDLNHSAVSNPTATSSRAGFGKGQRCAHGNWRQAAQPVEPQLGSTFLSRMGWCGGGRFRRRCSRRRRREPSL